MESEFPTPLTVITIVGPGPVRVAVVRPALARAHVRTCHHLDTTKCRWAIVCATGTPRATRPVPQRIT
jgi:hypothetical protein